MPAVDMAASVTTLCKYTFDPHTIAKGLDYQARGRVVHSNALLHRNKVEIHATVQGSQRQPYVVEVQVHRQNNRSDIEAICTCPVGFDCKHAVAAIADVFGKEGMRLFHVGASRVTIEEPETSCAVSPEPLSPDCVQWLRGLTPPEPAACPKPAPVKTIVYLLENNDGGLRLRIMQSTLKKNGTLGKAALCYAPNLGEKSPQLPEDLALLRELAGAFGHLHEYPLHGEFGAKLLPRLLATGKCHWEKVMHDRPLQAAPPRTGTLEWEIQAGGMQAPVIRVPGEMVQVLPLTPPYYVEPATGQCGVLETGQDVQRVRHWIEGDVVPPEQTQALGRMLHALGLPAPREIPVVERQHVRGTPVLRLMHVALPQPVSYWKRNGACTEISELDLARVEFDYAGRRVLKFDNADILQVYRDGRVERIWRDFQREEQAFKDVKRFGFLSADSIYGYHVPPEYYNDAGMETQEAWLKFMEEGLPRLRQLGWVVDIDRDFRFQYAKVEDWYSETAAADGEGSGTDWFSLELGILVDGQRHNLLPMIRSVLEQLDTLGRQQQRPVVMDMRLPDGRYVQLPAERVLAIGQILAELYDPASLTGGRLKVSRLRAAELVEIPGTGQWKGAEELRQLAQRIRSYKGIAPVPPPTGLNATLRPYQLEGLAWLQFLREYGFGGILADDMGLGKTIEMLAHLLLEKESGRANLPTLVVAPTSLMANWRAEAERFAPSLKVLVSHGGERKEHFERLADFDLIVTSYSLLPRDEEVLKKQPFHLLVLDEAQYVKNPNTKWADVARSLSSRHRLCMSGTPMENHLGELWSLMTFLSPGYLGSQQQFGRMYRTPIEKHHDPDRKKALAQRVRPFILRRRKEEVALDLPPKSEISRTVELAGAQRDLYETIRLAMHDRVREEIAKKGMDRSHIIILDALLKLRQVCCDPRLVKLDRARTVKESAKLDLLRDMLPELLEEGRRILLFSQFTSMLDLIEPELRQLKVPFVRLSGDTVDRETPVRRFQAGEVPLFLISLKAGGTGLNLTAADSVIHYDPWWNPAVEQQATDRAHRIGQDKPVFVYKLVTKGTVEEKIVAMQERKRELVASLLDDGAQQNLRLSREELEHLFDPIA
jgi:hypothetical protein